MKLRSVKPRHYYLTKSYNYLTRINISLLEPDCEIYEMTNEGIKCIQCNLIYYVSPLGKCKC